MSQSTLTIIAITTAKPGKEAALRAAQEELVAETLREDGCLRYELHQSLDDDRIRIFVETWASESQWRAHMEGAAMQRFQARGVGDYFADFALHRLNQIAGS
ncbi:antibiotic biosynthesis monooxygenase [Sphingobium yanoikuyae]|uniref:Antibiotic biosynthesis monooxygenase n=1 Tax=Sphingobium yanoikuyae TaxID=13690 RepID=A0A3G2UZF6_SPHYA|nr:putative quinol monooxygenase [Sphingobium yanoikuyae]AYO80064.1 antibiotic biosynthesis monooxygenase [Sphingobium yanoikuyae]KZC81106.1 antibiotic biosynthesis monooxygenase [Sphingobium yanoikuyae]